MTCHISPPSGSELLANIEGLLKKFRVTKENEKEEEIFTLANLDNGCIRKFIVKKVDESAFLASINNKGKEDSKSLTDENENTAVLEGDDVVDQGYCQPLVPNNSDDITENHKNDKKPQALTNGKIKHIDSRKPARFKLGCDDDSEEENIMPSEDREDKHDPGVVNPTFFCDEEDEGCRGDESTASISTRSSPDQSPSHSPRLSFRSAGEMSPQASPRHSPVSHRSGNYSQRSSVSSVRKGILKKSGSSSTINMEMVNLGLQHSAAINAAVNAAAAASMNGYHRARFSDPYDESFVPADTHRFVSSPDESTGMTQKSLGGHRVKFILETGKPDHVTGSYDDIRIEKMERERIERIERGKNLEVTNSGDKGGRKCLLFCAAMLVLTASVITAGLYGSGKLKKITQLGHVGIQGSGSSSGRDTTVAPLTAHPIISYVSNALEVKFRIVNQNFTDQLKNTDSEKFKYLADDLEKELRNVLFSPEVEHNGKADLTLKIIKFEPGSIYCTFRISWRFYGDSKVQTDQTPPLNITSVKSRLQNHIQQGNMSLKHEYEVPVDSVVVDKIIDKCRNNETKCSDGCQFSPETLRFICTCPDHMYIAANKTTCVPLDQSQQTKKVPIDHVINEVLINRDAILVEINQEPVINNAVKDKKTDSDNKEDSELSKELADSEKVEGSHEDNSTEIHSLNGGATNVTDLTGNNTSVSTDTSGNATIIASGASNTTQTPLLSANETGNVSTTISVNETESTQENSGSHDNSSGIIMKNETLVLSEEGNNTDITVTGPADANSTISNSSHLLPDEVARIAVAQLPLLNVSALFPVVFVSPGTRPEVQVAFTNSSADHVPPYPDLSVLRPGDSPGDVRLQEMNMTIPLLNPDPQDRDTQSVTLNSTDIDSATNVTMITTNASHNESSSEIHPNTNTAEPLSTTPPLLVSISGSEKSDEGENERKVEDDVLKEVVTVQAFPHEIYPGSPNRTPPPVTTSTTTSRPPTKFTEFPRVTDKPPKVSVNRTSETVIISSEVNVGQDNTTDQNSSEVQPLGIDFGIIVDASSDLGSMVGNSTMHVDNINGGNTAPVSMPSPESSPSKTTFSTTSEVSTTQGSHGNEETTPKFPGAHEHTLQHNEEKTTTPVSTSLNPKLPCAEDQVECVNGTSPLGRCIPRSARCNSIPDCSDISDEIHCFENNCFGNFQCNDNECIERQYVCDGVTNCREGDDELNCESWECQEDEFKCGGPEPSPCIPLGLRCDGQPDCFDHSDEVNCSTSCQSFEFACAEGWCIPSARKCDGIPDCYGGEDEENCGCTSLDETRCEVGGCVPTLNLCDGLRQCPDGSDEWGCLRIKNNTRQLEVRSGVNRWSAVCGEGWTSQFSDLVCQQLGSVASRSTEVRRVNEAVPRPRVKLAPKALPTDTTPLQFALKSDCASDTLVHLDCDPRVCGSWEYGSDVVGKEGATQVESQWPSLALLLPTHPFKDTHLRAQSCTASILTPVWILAAYSCLSAKENGLIPSTWAVETGKSTTNGPAQFHYIDKMVHYPGMVRSGGLWSGDAVLMHLNKPLTLDESTKPICIPDAPPPTDAHCVVAGWSRTHYGASSQSQFLHSLPVPALGLNDCNTTHYQGRLSSAHTCVAFAQAQHPPCHGDEGSPLMCMSESGVWRLEGLLSHHARCGRSKDPSIFTALHALQPWLGNTIGLLLKDDSSTTTTTTTTSTTTTTTTEATTSHTTSSSTESPPTSDPPQVRSEDFEDSRPQVSSPGNAPLPL